MQAQRYSQVGLFDVKVWFGELRTLKCDMKKKQYIFMYIDRSDYHPQLSEIL